ncbi:MAG TPA: helix-turn-helix transcriptional regulator [Candidatus Nitrosocosmicus sp.]|nr:helix-turn-helix transcriptional regulator [Candidatus Nitrosocosmicus sp.]
MKQQLIYTFQSNIPKPIETKISNDIEKQIAQTLIKKRLAKKLSQRELAKKVNTTQVVISRIETMKANPSIHLLNRIAEALDTQLILKFK